MNENQRKCERPGGSSLGLERKRLTRKFYLNLCKSLSFYLSVFFFFLSKSLCFHPSSCIFCSCFSPPSSCVFSSVLLPSSSLFFRISSSSRRCAGCPFAPLSLPFFSPYFFTSQNLSPLVSARALLFSRDDPPGPPLCIWKVD